MNLNEYVEKMHKGYVDCAMFTCTIDFTEEGNDASFRDEGYDISDLTVDAWNHTWDTCGEFAVFQWLIIKEMDPYDVGMNLWYSRNGHGTGFWDRGLGGVGDVLHDACKWNEEHLWLRPDGKVDIDG